MTELAYLPADEYETAFEATVVDSGPGAGEVVLDSTLFYKEGGGQPADRGTLAWGDESEEQTATVVDVRRDHGEVRHVLADGDPVPPEGATVRGEIDWERRYGHMRHHTAQHLLSHVVLEEYGASTAGNQVYADRARIDFEPADFDPADLDAIEARANELIDADLPVERAERPREEVEERTPEGRTNLDLIPDHVDPLRVVTIGDVDVCPCGGTHVDSLGELGGLTITERTSKGADVERLEFVLDETPR